MDSDLNTTNKTSRHPSKFKLVDSTHHNSHAEENATVTDDSDY